MPPVQKEQQVIEYFHRGNLVMLDETRIDRDLIVRLYAAPKQQREEILNGRSWDELEATLFTLASRHPRGVHLTVMPAQRTREIRWLSEALAKPLAPNRTQHAGLRLLLDEANTARRIAAGANQPKPLTTALQLAEYHQLPRLAALLRDETSRGPFLELLNGRAFAALRDARWGGSWQCELELLRILDADPAKLEGVRTVVTSKEFITGGMLYRDLAVALLAQDVPPATRTAGLVESGALTTFVDSAVANDPLHYPTFRASEIPALAERLLKNAVLCDPTP